MKVNNFENDLEYSFCAGEEIFWQAFYKQSFPDLEVAISNDGNNFAQRLGIDRILFIKSGKTLYIDEKKRRKKYNDILLEFKSNSNNAANDGWMNKILLIDYLAYAFMESKEVYLFDWVSLRRAWKKMGLEWYNLAEKNKNGFKIVQAQNQGYYTLSIAIPITILCEEVSVKPIVVIEE